MLSLANAMPNLHRHPLNNLSSHPQDLLLDHLLDYHRDHLQDLLLDLQMDQLRGRNKDLHQDHRRLHAVKEDAHSVLLLELQICPLTAFHLICCLEFRLHLQLHAVREVALLEQLLDQPTCQVMVDRPMLLPDFHPLLKHLAAKVDALLVLPQLHAAKEVAHLEQLPECLTCQVPIALLMLL